MSNVKNVKATIKIDGVKEQFSVNLHRIPDGKSTKSRWVFDASSFENGICSYQGNGMLYIPHELIEKPKPKPKPKAKAKTGKKTAANSSEISQKEWEEFQAFKAFKAAQNAK